jgi:hypothetical protein
MKKKPILVFTNLEYSEFFLKTIPVSSRNQPLDVLLLVKENY